MKTSPRVMVLQDQPELVGLVFPKQEKRSITRELSFSLSKDKDLRLTISMSIPTIGIGFLVRRRMARILFTLTRSKSMKTFVRSIGVNFGVSKIMSKSPLSVRKANTLAGEQYNSEGNA